MLPVAQRSDVHMQQLRKFQMAQAKLRAQLLDRKRLDVKLARRCALTARSLVHLLHALDELGKKLLVHL